MIQTKGMSRLEKGLKKKRWYGLNPYHSCLKACIEIESKDIHIDLVVLLDFR